MAHRTNPRREHLGQAVVDGGEGRRRDGDPAPDADGRHPARLAAQAHGGRDVVHEDPGEIHQQRVDDVHAMSHDPEDHAPPHHGGEQADAIESHGGSDEPRVARASASIAPLRIALIVRWLSARDVGPRMGAPYNCKNVILSPVAQRYTRTASRPSCKSSALMTGVNATADHVGRYRATPRSQIWKASSVAALGVS